MLNRRGFFKSLATALAAPFCAPFRSRAAVIARIPYLQNVGPDRAALCWTSDQVGQGAVWLVNKGASPTRVPATVKELLPSDTGLDSSSYLYTAECTALLPNTEYFYQVTTDEQTPLDNNTFHFRTAGTAPFSFLAFGDSGSGLPEQEILTEWMKAENPALVLHLGDLAYPNGAFREYQLHYFDVYRDLMKQVPFFPCPGNHGYMTRDGFPFLTLQNVPAADLVPPAEQGRYYSFDWGNAHFVAVDSNAPLSRAAQGQGHMLKWLERDLSATEQFWKIVYFHHPPFAGGPNQADPLSELARNYLVPLVERSGVQLVLTGHEHSYQRSYPLHDRFIVNEGQGTVYITSGGGGASLYPVNPHPLVAMGQSAHHYLRVEVNQTRLAVRAIGLSGGEIDEVSLAPLPQLSQGVEILSSPNPAAHVARIPGRNLAPALRSATGGVLPYELEGIAVTANGHPLSIRQVSPVHVEAEIPLYLSGRVTLEVRTQNGSAATPVSLPDERANSRLMRYTRDRLREMQSQENTRPRIAIRNHQSP